MSNRSFITETYKYLGINNQKTSHKEKIISGIGGFISISVIYFISILLLDSATAVYIIPSMGASAVLLFAAPHVPFSQPWNVFGGHLISAAIGVTCALLIDNIAIAAAASVGIAISAMYYTQCTHPPGGATALAAVIGSTKLHSLGYLYIIAPVFINVTTILIIALLFNGLFGWRRYPAYLYNKLTAKKSSKAIQCYEPISHEDFVYALSQVDSFIDVTEADLLKIYSLATGRKPHIDTPK
jgi:CBS-domain-containing membrane protein